MRGFPKTIATMQDIINLKDKYPKETKKFLEGLIRGSKVYTFTKNVIGNEELAEQIKEENKVASFNPNYIPDRSVVWTRGAGDSPNIEKIRELKDGPVGKSLLYIMGFKSVEEVQLLIDSI